MVKKIIIGILALTVITSTAAAVAYNVGKSQAAPLIAEEPYIAEDIPASNPVRDNNIPHEASPLVEAEGIMGEPFTALAQIRGFDTTGMNVVFETGETAYIELGPEEYWRSQSVELRETDIVTIEGYANEEMYHAVSVTTADGEQIVLRSESGQPLWSGNDGQSPGGGSQDGTHTSGSQGGQNSIQIPAEDWVTYTGTLSAIANGRMTIRLEDGTSISFRTGQPRFFRSQGVEFSIGDQVEVVGFYNNGSFSAGDVVQLSTGIRVMLLDPNGRPLWAGPGNSTGSPLPTSIPAP
ncbi:MAG: hypothetical protein JW757_00450 [Anaerolineales bacterium]|nr:hypothetical protein [Anaerolineales bacterium]